MSYFDEIADAVEITALIADAPAIVRAAMERGGIRVRVEAPTEQLLRVKYYGHARAASPNGRARVPHPELRGLSPAEYARRLRAMRRAAFQASGLTSKGTPRKPKRVRKPRIMAEQPRPGEVMMKEWISQRADDLGITVRAAWVRYYRGHLPAPTLRKINARRVFVSVNANFLTADNTDERG